MSSPIPMLRALVIQGALVCLCACGGGGDAPAADAAAPPDASSATCTQAYREPDLAPPGETPPWMGPGADASGALVATPGAEGFVVAATYLRLDPDGATSFQGHVEAIVPALMASPGLVAVSLTGSMECGTARTLSVWRDEASMMAFVSGSAHLAAMADIGEISRGGSVTEHWVAASAEEASWESAFTRIAASEGPYY